MGKIRISAVICAKDEGRTIREVVRQAKRHADEVIVVDGRSSDGTREEAEKEGATVIIDEGRGKGQAVRMGLARAKGVCVVLLDADGSHDPSEIPALAAPVLRGEADLVVGSRALGSSDELDGSFDARLRDLFGSVITGIANLRFGTHITDTQNGFRAIRRAIVPCLGLTEDGFTIEQQMTIRCLKKGFLVLEISSHESRRRHDRSRISLPRHGPRYAWCLLREVLTG